MYNLELTFSLIILFKILSKEIELKTKLIAFVQKF